LGKIEVMANLKSLAKDTAIYGLSSIVGRFLNYLLVPLYTYYMPHETGDYGVSTNIYAYTALILVLLTFGMETTLFRFANDERYQPDTVFSTAMATVGSLTAVFLLIIFGFIGSISSALGYSEHPDYLLMMAVVVPETSYPLCLAEDAVHPAEHRLERVLLCGAGQDFRILRVLHQSALHRTDHLLLPARLVPHSLEVRRTAAEDHVRLLVAYPDLRYCGYSESGSRQDHLPVGISRPVAG